MDEIKRKDALKIWKTICFFGADKSIERVYFRFYYSGEIWLLDSINPDYFIWSVGNLKYYNHIYIPEILNEICAIANENGVKIFSNYSNTKYIEYSFIF